MPADAPELRAVYERLLSRLVRAISVGSESAETCFLARSITLGGMRRERFQRAMGDIATNMWSPSWNGHAARVQANRLEPSSKFHLYTMRAMQRVAVGEEQMLARAWSLIRGVGSTTRICAERLIAHRTASSAGRLSSMSWAMTIHRHRRPSDCCSDPRANLAVTLWTSSSANASGKHYETT